MQMLNLNHREDFETRLSTKKKIKEALKDKDISIIGICGMSGIGKTTMAKEIVNEVKDEKLFKEVAFAVVSNDPDISKIQDQLGEALGLKIEEKTNTVRAGRLCQRVEGNDGKSILVTLDDVWNEIDLGTIGVPSPHDRKGLKIMFTTRIEETCSKMKAQRKFEIEVLDEKEGWQLFKDMSGISDDETDDELVSMAKKVADECRGLPLALVVVGKALESNKATYKWSDALLQLQYRATNLDGMDDIVYNSIRLSFNFLVSNEERDLLLLCSLFAEDENIPIENLVQYARGLELFENTETLSQTRDRAKIITDNLKGCYLLQSGREEDEVKLHDVIRDFCLKMATKDKCGYLVNHAGLEEWPEHDTDNSCSAISITFNKLDQLHSGLKHRNVKLLRMMCRKLGRCNNFEEFFEDTKELRVLELKLMNIQIPSSIQLLTGLRTLCLISCVIHSQLSMIGSLKKLEILSFYCSYFSDYCPIELANLSNLRSLDLRFLELSCPLRPGILSSIKKLEELYLGDSIPIEGEDQRYIIEELSSLTFLHTFQISTLAPILMQLLKASFLENLEKFQILVGTTQRGRFENFLDFLVDKTHQGRFGHRYITRSLYLEDGIDASMLLQPSLNTLMKRTYHLRIEANKVLKNVVSDLDGNGFINLKTLILSNGDFEYLIDATNAIPNATFGKLESLKLEDLPKLIEICNGNIPGVVFKPPLFCNLMTIQMYVCEAITSLFRESVAKCLVNLQRLDIAICSRLEEVVSTDTQGNEVTKTCEMIEFPKLKIVDLTNLGRFKSFTCQSNSGDVCQTLFNKIFSFDHISIVNTIYKDRYYKESYTLDREISIAC
ncbi:disease resistance At4g27190-like [Olea europaea subsp. europaea]|uniref:Disease resistance At4g27190-like n=1 Tax=Olea europaea subsp. europaea TaxID=158383 RepID=A0A8S0PCH2_OLEEU|nr:disease resistance At4g27190-like [Olea europaea subsp. europaea]